MKAIILAAGRGSRMKELTDEKPKCLIEFNGKPLIEWQLKAIKKTNIQEIGIVTGYKQEMLSDYDLVQFFNPNWDGTQMVYSLCYASNWLEKTSCIISYSDIYYDSSAIQFMMDCNADISLTYDTNWLKLWKKRFGDPLLDAETFRLNSDGFLAEIGKKPTSVEEIQGQYMGLLKFTPRAWKIAIDIMNSLPSKEIKIIHMTDLLQLLVESKKINIKPLPYDKTWGEFDSATDLNSFSND